MCPFALVGAWNSSVADICAATGPVSFIVFTAVHTNSLTSNGTADNQVPVKSKAPPVDKVEAAKVWIVIREALFAATAPGSLLTKSPVFASIPLGMKQKGPVVGLTASPKPASMAFCQSRVVIKAAVKGAGMIDNAEANGRSRYA